MRFDAAQERACAEVASAATPLGGVQDPFRKPAPYPPDRRRFLRAGRRAPKCALLHLSHKSHDG